MMILMMQKNLIPKLSDLNFPASTIYEDNNLNFHILMKNHSTMEEWLIGKGFYEIKILQYESEFIIEKVVKANYF